MWRALHSTIFGTPTLPAPVPANARKADPLDGPPAPWRTRTEAHKGAHGFVAVVGESHYQETLRQLSDFFALIGRGERTFTATLKPEPANAYDSNAVAVTTDDGTTIGYLAREMAETYQKRLLRQTAVVRCPAQLRGGGDGGQVIGVVLDFEEVHV